MAKITGSFTGNNSNVGIYVEYTYTQDVTNNRSTVTAKFYGNKKTTYGTTYNNQAKVSMQIGDQVLYNKTQAVDYRPLAVGGTMLIASCSRTITHNADGTGKVYIGAFLDMGNTSVKTGSVESTVTLPTIPRKTSVSTSGSSYFGSTITITHAGASTAFTHTLRYSCGSASGTIATNKTGTSTSWTVPKSLQSQIPNSKSTSMKILCDTYSGSTLIGTTETSYTIYIADDCLPSISSTTFSDGMAKPSGVTGYWQNFSKVKAVVSAAGVYGSTIKTYSITVGGDKGSATSSSSTLTTGTITSSGTYNVTVTVTDSRGRSVSKTYSNTIVVTPYSAPSITSLSYKRMEVVDGIESPSNMGTVGYVSFTRSWHSNSTNRAIRFYYKTESASSWTEIVMSDADYTDYKFSSSLSTADAYILRVKITDQLSVITKDITMANIFPLISMNPAGNGVAFGMESTAPERVDFNLDVKLHKNRQVIVPGTSLSWLNGALGWRVPIYQYESQGTSAYVPLLTQRTSGGSWSLGTYTNNSWCMSFVSSADMTASNNYVTSQYKFDSTRTGYWKVLGINDTYNFNYPYVKINTGTYNATNSGVMVQGAGDPYVHLWAGSGGGVCWSNKNLHLGGYESTRDIICQEYNVQMNKLLIPKQGIQTNTLHYDTGSTSGYGDAWGVGVQSHLYPTTTSRYCGVSSYRWQGVYSVTSVNVSSDARLKHDINYVSKYQTYNGDSLTTDDFLEFIKSDLKIATYFYNQNIDNLSDDEVEFNRKMNVKQVGFIAQDIVDTKVGNYIITEDDNGTLGYETGNYMSVIAGALQNEIHRRESDIAELKMEIQKLKEIIKGA